MSRELCGWAGVSGWGREYVNRKEREEGWGVVGERGRVFSAQSNFELILIVLGQLVQAKHITSNVIL